MERKRNLAGVISEPGFQSRAVYSKANEQSRSPGRGSGQSPGFGGLRLLCWNFNPDSVLSPFCFQYLPCFLCFFFLLTSKQTMYHFEWRSEDNFWGEVLSFNPIKLAETGVLLPCTLTPDHSSVSMRECRDYRRTSLHLACLYGFQGLNLDRQA